MSRIAAIGLAILVGACAPRSYAPVIKDEAARKEAILQSEMAIQREFDMNRRLYNVYWPIAVNNKEICGDDVGRPLPILVTAFAVADPQRQAAGKKLYGVTPEDRFVVTVAKGSAPDKAGIKPGDIYIGLNGEKQNWVDTFYEVRDTKGEKITLNFLRNGKPYNATFVPELACKYSLDLLPDSIVNAYANGRHIVVHAGMMDFARTDEELALILGHEMAHNAMGHIEAKKGNQFAGVLLGATISVLTGINVTDLGAKVGAGAFSQEFEAEADYVGTYITARAGYDISNAAMLWRRMGVINPQAIHLAGSTHPSTAKRFLAIEQAVKEIADKRAAGQPLLPEMKPTEHVSTGTEECQYSSGANTPCEDATPNEATEAKTVSTPPASKLPEDNEECEYSSGANTPCES